MAIINGTSVVDVSFTDENYVEFASFVTQNSTTVSWLTTNGSLITLTGNFVISGGPPTGTVDKIEFNAFNNAAIDQEIIFSSSMNIIAELLADADSFWQAALSGADTFTNPGNNTAGDFREIASGETRTGSDDIAQVDRSFHGDAYRVYGTLTGGDDQITMYSNSTSAIVAGDTYFQLSGSILNGGNDTISDSTTASVGSGRTLTGDVQTLFGGTSLTIAYGGNDTISGNGSWSYTLSGDAGLAQGNSRIYGGDDTLNGSTLGDILIGDVLSMTLLSVYAPDLYAGNDTINGGGGNDVIYGEYETGQDSWVLVNFENYLGADILNGGAGDDEVYGQLGNDIIDGGSGDDTLDGGSGLDTISFASATGIITFDLSVSTQDTGAGIDTQTGFENILGSSHADTITGDDNDNIINGGDGDDIIDGGLGDDIVYGDGGNDQIIRNFGSNGENEYYGGEGVDTFVSSAPLGSAILVDLGLGQLLLSGNLFEIVSGFENYEGQWLESVTGSIDSNTITMTGNYDNVLMGLGGDDVLDGGGGDDQMDGGDDNDTASYASATSSVTVSLAAQGVAQNTVGAGVDTLNNFESLIGSDHNDTLTGDDQVNTITGGAGSDNINGGAGNDILNGGTGVDTVDGGDGIDTLDLSGATNTQKVNLVTNVNIGGFAHNDTFLNIENVIGSDTRGDDITGTAGTNTLSGMGADDILRGFNGDDILEGGENNDYLFGGRGADVLDGGNGNDWAMYNDSSHGVTVDLGGTGSGGIYSDGDTYTSIERVRGSNHNDTITMDGGINKVLAGDGDDTVFGMGGKDQLRGGNDNDRLNGGADNDTLFGDAGSDIFEFDLNSGADFVADFENNIDTIELDSLLDGGALAGLTGMQVVDTYANQVNPNRIDLNFGNGDVLKILATGITFADLYDDVVVV